MEGLMYYNCTNEVLLDELNKCSEMSQVDSQVGRVESN
ncbi:uncharacterized protein OCT59_007837 [Rhizophagus irregularis]|nr:hypothetical protein OCT59_007837 [Rhizophagus irregularis]